MTNITKDVSFIFPKKIYTQSAKLEGEGFNSHGEEFFVQHGKKIWFDTQKQRIASQTASDYSQVFVIRGEKAIPLFGTFTENWKENLSLKIDSINGMKDRLDSAFSDTENPEKYEAKQAVIIEANRVSRETERAELEKRKELNKQKIENEYAEKLEQSKIDLLAGRAISWKCFKSLCNQYDVKLPLRTIGSGRKNVVSIGCGTMRILSGTSCKSAHSACTLLTEKLRILKAT